MTVTHTFALFAISLCLSVLQAETCNTDTTPSQPHPWFFLANPNLFWSPPLIWI